MAMFVAVSGQSIFCVASESLRGTVQAGYNGPGSCSIFIIMPMNWEFVQLCNYKLQRSLCAGLAFYLVQYG